MSISAKTNLSYVVTQEVLQELTHAIESLRFGSVEITVHDGKVTQIERREKVRFGQESSTKKL
ncbi:MAG TPA: YezD family protein [Methylophilaceae bacterium]|jgi:hypothetical protein